METEFARIADARACARADAKNMTREWAHALLAGTRTAEILDTLYPGERTPYLSRLIVRRIHNGRLSVEDVVLMAGARAVGWRPGAANLRQALDRMREMNDGARRSLEHEIAALESPAVFPAGAYPDIGERAAIACKGNSTASDSLGEGQMTSWLPIAVLATDLSPVRRLTFNLTGVVVRSAGFFRLCRSGGSDA